MGPVAPGSSGIIWDAGEERKQQRKKQTVGVDALLLDCVHAARLFSAYRSGKGGASDSSAGQIWGAARSCAAAAALLT